MMWSVIRQNTLFLILIVMTLNFLTLSAICALSMRGGSSQQPAFDIIDCADAASRIHKCIRIDPQAGEFNQNDASYRMIYGH